MPQTDIYLCEDDLTDLGQLFFRQGASMIPDIEYPTQKGLTISTLTGLEEILSTLRPSLFFVVSPQWQRSPVELDSIEKEGRTVFFISQKNGGPTLDIFCPRPIEVNGDHASPHGFIAYHARFWNPISRRMEDVPQALKEMYRMVRSHLVRDSRKIIRKRRQLFITKRAKESCLEFIDLKSSAKDPARFVNVD